MGTAKVLVAGSNVSASQLKDLFRQIEDGSLNSDQIQALLDHRNPFEPLVFPNAIDWSKVYRELGLEAEFLHALPDLDRESKGGLWWVPVVKGVTPNKLVACFRKLGVDIYTYIDDLDKDVSTNDRSPATGSYVVRFRQDIEADSEHKNKSAKMLAKAGIKGITLIERLLLELGFFLQTGDHLDKENITLCSGSRRLDGDLPGVRWDAGRRRLYVDWYHPDGRDGNLCARAAVSLSAEASAKAG